MYSQKSKYTKQHKMAREDAQSKRYGIFQNDT